MPIVVSIIDALFKDSHSVLSITMEQGNTKVRLKGSRPNKNMVDPSLNYEGYTY